MRRAPAGADRSEGERRPGRLGRAERPGRSGRSGRLGRPGWRGRLRRPDRGGVAIEAAIVVPGVVALVLLAIAAGRVQTAAGTVEAAARVGARTGSLQRSVTAVDEPAKKSALATLRQQGVSCRNSDVQVAQAPMDLPGGRVVAVTVTVTCDVELADLLGGPSGLPVTKHLVGEFTSVMDRYRGT